MNFLNPIKLKRHKIRDIALFSILTVTFVVLISFFGGKTWIIFEANNMAKEASTVFHKDKIESLLLIIISDNYSLKEKNKAIWALGILKDERALRQLEMLYTGEDCNHKEEICQYEIKKAILKFKGEFRVSWQASN